MIDMEVDGDLGMEERIARYDAAAPVHWRWELAHRIADGEINDPGEITPALAAAVEFLRRRAAGQPPNNEEGSTIVKAQELFEADTPLRWELEARLLAGETDAEIARKTGLPVATIAMYEPLFFAVRYCRGATGYLLSQTMNYAHLRGFQDGEVREFWAWSALAGGPLIVDHLVRVFHEARRNTEPPKLGIYLRDGACDLRLQSFIAVQVIPREDDTRWFLDFPVRLQAAQRSANPKASLNRIDSALVQCARTVLETGEIPEPPGWWRSQNASQDRKKTSTVKPRASQRTKMAPRRKECRNGRAATPRDS